MTTDIEALAETAPDLAPSRVDLPPMAYRDRRHIHYLVGQAKGRAVRGRLPHVPDTAAAVAEFLARGGQITRCPTRYAEPSTGAL